MPDETKRWPRVDWDEVFTKVVTWAIVGVMATLFGFIWLEVKSGRDRDLAQIDNAREQWNYVEGLVKEVDKELFQVRKDWFQRDTEIKEEFKVLRDLIEERTFPFLEAGYPEDYSETVEDDGSDSLEPIPVPPPAPETEPKPASDPPTIPEPNMIQQRLPLPKMNF